MESETAPPETPATSTPAKPRGGWRKSLPHLPVLIGVIGLGAAITTGVTTKRRDEARVGAEVQAIRAELKLLRSGVGEFRSKIEDFRWQAAKVRAQAMAATAEPEGSWRREQARLFEALVQEVEARVDEGTFFTGCAEVEALCEKKWVAAARERLRRVPELRFPAGEAFRGLHESVYARPLAQFSRQNPGYYRLLKENEPEIAGKDFASLRATLEKLGVAAMTPQAMLGFDLFAAVAPEDDPLLADWRTLATAADFFEDPDEPTIARWRRAQAAVRKADWSTAVAEMQAIERTKVRTRQAFRAAYGRAILRNTPDAEAEAYPYFQEAARGGDREARAWVSEQDFAAERYESARGWLEARIEDGEREAVEPLLKIYAMQRADLPRDLLRERGVLNRILAGADAPAEASMLLARNYEDPTAEPDGAKAFMFYLRAARGGHEPAWIEVAQRYAKGEGVAAEPAAAALWATKAFAAGERERSVPLLLELMQRSPERVVAQIQSMFERESVSAPGGYTETRVEPSGVTQLKVLVARFLDRKGMFAQAAKVYETLSGNDAGARQRLAELTAAHTCEECAGAGKVRTTPDCSICAGKGTIACGACSGRGYAMVPEVPACTTCVGAGGLVQDGRAVVCATCTGTGKGKPKVVRKPCASCAAGKVDCGTCEGGKLHVTKECARCRGKGTQALVDR